MKARIPKSFESLPPKEKAVISQMIQEEAYKLADKEHAEVQENLYATLLYSLARVLWFRRETPVLFSWKLEAVVPMEQPLS